MLTKTLFQSLLKSIFKVILGKLFRAPLTGFSSGDSKIIWGRALIGLELTAKRDTFKDERPFYNLLMVN